MAEHRSRFKAELPFFLVIIIQSCNIRGQQVGGKLDPGKLSFHRSCQGFGQLGLSRSRHIFQKNMSLNYHSSQDQVNGLPLPNDHLFYIVSDCF